MWECITRILVPYSLDENKVGIDFVGTTIYDLKAVDMTGIDLLHDFLQRSGSTALMLLANPLYRVFSLDNVIKSISPSTDLSMR